MPRTETITRELFQFAELSDRAKERARDWFREGIGQDTFWSEHTAEDFAEVLKACGFSIDRAPGRRTEPAIYWSLNPDSAGFVGSWSASRCDVAAIIADRPVSYTDRDGVQQQCKHNARLVPILERAALLASTRPHSYGSVTTQRNGDSIGETEWRDDECTDLECNCEGLAADFGDLCRDLAGFLAWALSTEWDYQHSAECVDDNITANEYEFTADGERA